MIVPNRGRFDLHESNLPLKFFHKKRKRWLTTTIFFSVPCYNGTMLNKDYYNDFFELGQQKINFSFFELCLPDDDPVYTLKKVMKINEQWEALKEESHKNIQSEKGSLNRQIRSIQTEGYFGDIKENDSFRRFNYRTSEKVYKEFMLYAIGRNINKYHRFLHEKIQKFEGKIEETVA